MAVAKPIECIFFDCDDCLYRNEWATAHLLTSKIRDYCWQKFGLSQGKLDELYKTYGTTLCGLVREGLIPEAQVGDFLQQVHDIPLEDIHPDPRLRTILEAVPHPRWVFTASIREHAQRCLQRLGIEDLFLGIVSASSPDMIQMVGYVTKHDPRCFAAAMEFAGIPTERRGGCFLLDDSASNLRTAKQTGWRTVLVGRHNASGAEVDRTNADFVVGSLHELPDAVPELFAPRGLVATASADALAAGEKRSGAEAMLATPSRRVLRRVDTAPTPSKSLEGQRLDNSDTSPASPRKEAILAGALSVDSAVEV